MALSLFDYPETVFNRDHLNLLMLLVPMLPVNFTLHVNSQHLYDWLAKKQGIICVSTKCLG